MKTENLVIICVTIFLLGLTVALPTYWYNMNKVAFNNGYERGTLQGEDGTYWVKVK